MAHKQALGLMTRPGFSATRIPTLSTTISQATPRSIVGARNVTTAPRYNQLQAERGEEAKAMERQFFRDWNVGDVYAPHDLSAAEARKWKAKKAPTTDVFDVLSINPLDVYKNFSIMSEFVTELGRIRPRSQTGLRLVNQRRLAKAIRRAQALGLMPTTYIHPEIIKYNNIKNKAPR